VPATWPTNLPPSPLVGSFADQLGDGRTLPKTTYGVGKRRAFWPGLRKLTVSYNLSFDQYNTLQLFWEITTRRGIDPFYWGVSPIATGFLYTEDGTPLTDENGVPLLSTDLLLVQFGSQPPRRTQAYTSDVFKVDVDLEILP
jgi:hypothetical protein